jgi:hypothetical protein
MPDFGIFRGFNDKLFGDKLYAGQLPINLGLIGSQNFSPLLLDTYTGAAAAYSLRLLRSGYTGSAIKVRRASDNTEQDIGFANNELDTTSLASFCSSTNGFVTTWYDQSGNAQNATQTTAANQPQIVSSGSVILENGKPAVEFDGINDRLVIQSTLSYFNFMHNGTKFLDYFVASKNGDVRADILGNITSGSELGAIYAFPFLNSNIFTVNGNGATNIGSFNISTNSPITSNIQYLINHISDNSNAIASNRDEIYVNAALAIKNNTVTVAPLTGNSSNLLTIGCRNPNGNAPFNGKIQEITIYSNDQSANRTGIANNVNDFYTIY